MNSKDQFIAPINLAIRFGIVVLAFLTPLFFLPITSEFYQFNKQGLVVVIAALLLVLWGVKMGLEGKMRIVRTPIDIPLIIFGVAFILASVFSVDQYISIAGFYPRFHGGLVSALAYIVTFFVAVSNLDKRSRNWVIWAFVASSTILALLSIANFFGYSVLSADYAKVRTWTPIGNPANLSLYLALVLPITLGAMATTKSRALQTLLLAAAIVMVIPIVLFKLIGPMIALGLGLLVALIFFPRINVNRKTQSMFGVFAAVAAVILLLNFIPEFQNTFLKPLMAKKQDFNVAADKTLPIGPAWLISTQSIGQRPFFGVGPGTFAYSFTAFKGSELNSNDLWNLRFDLAGNEYLTMLSTMGIVGLVTFMIVLFVLSRNLFNFNYRSDAVRENPTSIFLLSSLIIFLSGIFFQDTTASIWVFFVLLAALTFSYMKDWGVKNVDEVDVKFVALNAGGVQFVEPNDRQRDSSLGTVFTILGVIAFLTVLYFGWPAYQAEASYQKALVASTKDKAADTRSNLLDAINRNPNRDTYRRSLVVLDRLLATNLSKKDKKTDQDNNNIAGLVNEALQQGIRTTGYQGQGLNSFSVRTDAGTSSLNVANWEALSGVLSSLQLTGDQKTKNAADDINVATEAVTLDPRNPVLNETLGNILLKYNLVDNAIQAYQQAINVRPGYVSAHYNLAVALRQKGDSPARVVLELQNTKTLLPSDSPDLTRVNQELADAQKKLDEATASANKQTTTPLKTTK